MVEREEMTEPDGMYGEEIRHGVELLADICQALVHLDSSRVYRRLWGERRIWGERRR